MSCFESSRWRIALDRAPDLCTVAASIQNDELIRLAAKSISLNLDGDSDWNPLNNHCDAMQLVMLLGLACEVQRHNQTGDYVCAYNHELGVKETVKIINPHAFEAARQAITQAAAEIGRAM